MRKLMVKVIENCVKKKQYEPQDVIARTFFSTTFYIHCPCCGSEAIIDVQKRENNEKMF
jgi:transposase-like protein